MEERRALDRRVHRVAVRYPERRSGFDRRIPETGVGRRRHLLVRAYSGRPALLAACLAGILLLEVADLGLTLRAIGLGATEVNPIMAGLLDVGPLQAAVFKLTMATGVVAAIWVLRRYRRILEFSLALLIGMGLLVVYQAAGLTIINR